MTISDPQELIRSLRGRLDTLAEEQREAFEAGADIDALVRGRATATDSVLTELWQGVGLPDNLSLIAVGGYGRGELHPYSDIDLLILLPPKDDDGWQESVQQFVTLLWDLKLDIGHSVRTIGECVETAREDITVATSLMETRLLVGDAQALAELRSKTDSRNIWSSADFFSAKWAELLDRHKKFAHTEYGLEPNLKNSPGGLRDIQIISWVAMRHFGGRDLRDLVTNGFLTPDELTLLLESRDFLWQVRFALHELAGREEDRLLFDHQRQLAKRFGFTDDDAKLAVEGFMQRYYRCVKTVGEMRDMLIQLFDESILKACEAEEVWPISNQFNVRNNFLEACNDRVFEKHPSALLDAFVLLAYNEQLEGMRASTIRLIRSNTHLIDDAFRADERNRAAFMKILRAPVRVAQQLRLMHRFGVLGAYLPEWGRITGQMQHDLFHVYTVDAHTLELLKNLRRFQYPEFKERYPVASRVIQRLPKRELVYIAGIYHDIAKGRGGDHSKLGVVDARDFCARHGIGKRDTNLVAWLVENHLLMSSVSQRQDIQDPEVIARFARLVSEQQRLDYLYCLTVADINATNPTLWNNWRASLMRQLYAETSRALSRGLENPVDKQEWIQETQQDAVRILLGRGFTADEVHAIWHGYNDDYFLRETAEDIAWHTVAIAEQENPDEPLVLLRDSSETTGTGATQIFMRSPFQQWLFATTAAAIEQLDLNILDARVYRSDSSGHTLKTFYVLDADGKPVGDNAERVERIRGLLKTYLEHPERHRDTINRRTPRQMRMFNVPTRTYMSTDTITQYSVLEVIAADRPGLLARLGRILFDYGLQLQNAKITTLGERVEDVFFISDQDGNPVEDPELCEAIQITIREELDEQIDQAAPTAGA